MLFLSERKISKHSFPSVYANKSRHTSVTIISTIQAQALPSGHAVAPTCSLPSWGLGAGSGLGAVRRRHVSFADERPSRVCLTEKSLSANVLRYPFLSTHKKH